MTMRFGAGCGSAWGHAEVRRGSGLALVLLAVALGGCAGDDKPSSTPPPSAADASSDGDDSGASIDARVPNGLQTSCGAFEEEKQPTSAQHLVGNIDYPDPPPMGGNHNECWTTWGVHDKPEHVERWVHNLEHGGVVYLYHCPNGCAAEVAALTKLIDGKEQTLLTEYDALPKKFAAVSWGFRLVSDCFDEDAFRTFYTKHVDHGPESITSGPPTGCPPPGTL